MTNMLRKEKALERGLVQTIFKPCAEFLVKQAQLKSGERLLDIGCGSGIAARVALEQEPQLAAAHGFDYEPAAIMVAECVRTQHIGGEKLKFWTGNASNPKDYRGKWDVCIAQHVVRHVPDMLEPMREALAPKGRAVICTWPESSEECPAYRFLYTAADEGKKCIGISKEALSEKLRKAGFQHRGSVLTPQLYTPPVDPAEFLHQYLEGKVTPPDDIKEYLRRPELKEHTKSLAHRTYPDGKVQFSIAINAIVAWT
jgi:2-polyprenyl-3-methyl-5-hydroxy-6-metoxy-1,4-benzoquinol methylase